MESTILVAKAYGQANVLEFFTQTLPALSPGMARIKVKAAGINPIDARRMTGEFKFGPLPQTFGTEFAGEIVDIAPNTQFKIGAAVLGSGSAFTHATIIDVAIENLIPKPESISWEVAGSLAGVAQTAMTILEEIGNVKSLLIHGGSGGVGAITIQLAKEKGIDVVATASENNQEYLKNTGATPVVYGAGLVERLLQVHPEPFDASIDMSGTEEAAQASLKVVKPGGFIGSIAGKKLSVPVTAVWTKRHPSKLKYVTEGVAAGKFTWQIDEVFPFDKAQTAFAKVLEGHNKGKNVLTF